jgi:hypothetical protein
MNTRHAETETALIDRACSIGLNVVCETRSLLFGLKTKCF